MFKNIIVPIDLADIKSVAAVLLKALKYAEDFEAKLHFVYIIPDVALRLITDFLPKNLSVEQKNRAREQMESLIAQHIPSEVKVNSYIGRGSIYEEILKYSNEVQADLIMIYAVRQQRRDYMLGSNASNIVRHSGISVLVVRE